MRQIIYLTHMMLKVMAFGIARDIVGGSEIDFEITEGTSVADLKIKLLDDFPDFSKLRHIALAVNCEYANDDVMVQPSDEVVIIPPVSGG